MEYDHFEFQNVLTNFAKSSKNEPNYLMSVKLFVNGIDIVTDEYVIRNEILRRTLDQEEMEQVYSSVYGDDEDFVPQIRREYELPIITCTCFHAECLGIDYIKIVHFDNYIQWKVPYPLSEWKLSKSYRELLDAGVRERTYHTFKFDRAAFIKEANAAIDMAEKHNEAKKAWEISQRNEASVGLL